MATIPTAELTPLAPAKHMGFMEHHAQFAALVHDFAGACLLAAPFAEKTVAETAEARSIT